MSDQAKLPETLKGKVLRSFYFGGKVLQAGVSAELPRVFAIEMQAAKKFEIGAAEQPSEEPKAPKEKPQARQSAQGEKDAGK